MIRQILFVLQTNIIILQLNGNLHHTSPKTSIYHDKIIGICSFTHHHLLLFFNHRNLRIIFRVQVIQVFFRFFHNNRGKE